MNWLLRSLIPAVCVVLVAAACATSLQVTVEADSALQDSSAVSTPSSTSAPTAVVEPTPVASPTPVATPTAAPTATPAPDLPYEEAITIYFDDVERFWAEALPAMAGVEFTPVADRFPYDPDQAATVPACDGDIGPLELYRDNAFYCEPDDYIAWDDVGLFPELYDTYGDFTVGLVIAHEYSHAIQARAGLDGPTVFVELQADCFAGAWTASVAQDPTRKTGFSRTDLDSTIGGFLTFADPLGTLSSNVDAHGTAFDRVNAFAEGFERGVETCAGLLDDPPQTAALFIQRGDVTGGDLPLDELLPLLTDELSAFFEALGRREVGPAFAAPGAPIEFGGPLGDPPPCGVLAPRADEIIGSAYYCEADATVYLDRSELDKLWSEAGDFAPAYALAHGMSMALVVEFIQDDADAAVLAADCLVGVWARDVFDEARTAPAEPLHLIRLSAGDLDEGIVGLLSVPPLGPSLAVAQGLTSFDRVAEFGKGFFRGVSQCNFGDGPG